MSNSVVKWSFYDPTSTSTHSVSSSSPASHSISISSGPKTDWWTTAPGSQPESSAHRSSGPVVYQTVRLSSSQDWKLSGLVRQEGTERFQQTTLFVKRINPKEGANGEGQLWLKSGIENEGGRKYVGVVATNPFSDWNVSPLPTGSSSSVDIEIEKVGPDMHVYYSYPDASGKQQRFLLREKKGFALPLSAGDKAQEEEWWIGAMVCGPLTDETKGEVHGWKFELLKADRVQSH
ncbi:hypothetical protein NDA11_000123 [Ustilago hordei]|uniref:Uncharacterized protein n=1 Tax=Ustilago hordei TaxID=120017 RepID=I2FS40_USTHO|nr:uncharacterized protein UHO2_05864 [Ustilago hordei]KAJ1041920.1 hypothetical protein NDA10_002973 [Ustilago hordei]KAJ1573381.1 hypothetical protein NDA15_006370 [Ustilago hordei]KAJ1574741.1 hypothetical protein NDA12_002940 [Ustilago hordei]KAJ1576565.1 hypothetical protein NDA11_000123 [Ustilago hordei]KAJ1596352.1 hypothetical protein NDA14_005152 [Ustilago hordei]